MWGVAGGVVFATFPGVALRDVADSPPPKLELETGELTTEEAS